jgi:hypothetical protein
LPYIGQPRSARAPRVDEEPLVVSVDELFIVD